MHDAGPAYARLRTQRAEEGPSLACLEAWLTFKWSCVGEVIYGVSVPAPEVGGLCRGRRALTLPLAGASSCSWPEGSPQTVFLTWVPFFGSLSTAHFRSASLHHRSICHVNWGTRGSFSFGLVYGRIPRGIQNVLTQTNGTNKSEISLATSSWLQRENGEHLAEHWPTWKTHLSGRIQHKA